MYKICFVIFSIPSFYKRSPLVQHMSAESSKKIVPDMVYGNMYKMC